MATKDAAAANRKAAEDRARAESSKGGSRLVLIAVAVVALAGLAAFAISVAGDGGSRGSSVEDDAVGVTIDGDSLPPLPEAGPDPAVGAPFPALRGTGIDGEPLAIEPGRDPMVVVFLAHWCPVCQEEVPVIRDWVAAGGPGPVEVVAVSTEHDRVRGNWPPSRWLAGAGWQQPTLLDPDGAAGSVRGSRSVPFFVVVDADGDVVARVSGALSTEQLDALAVLATT